MRVNKLTVNLLEYSVLIGVCVWFILILTWNLSSPLNDASEVTPAIQIQRFLNNQSPFKPFEITLFNKHFPIMSDIKHGATELYLLMPFMFLGGSSIEALRLGYIFLVVLVIISIYYFCKEFFNAEVAKLTLLLLAINDSFFVYFRQGATFGLTMPLFTITSLISFFKWHKTRNNIYLYLGLILLSLGFQAKGWFIWFIIALFITALFFYLPLRKMRLKTCVLATTIFGVSLFPILHYYYLANFNKFIMSYAVVSDSGFNNSSILSNFLLRINQFNTLVGGSFIFGKLSWVFPIAIFWLCFFILVLKVSLNKTLTFSRNRVIIILSLFFLTLFMSAFTFTDYKEGHLLILFPFIQIIMAIGIIEIWRSKKKILRLGIILTMSLFLLINIFRYTEFYRVTKQEWRRLACSNIANLSTWLIENKVHRVRIFNWHIACIVEFFGNTKIDANVFRSFPVTGAPDYAMIKDAKAKDVFVFTFPDDLKDLANFKRLASELSRKSLLLKEFYYCDGSRRLAIYTLK